MDSQENPAPETDGALMEAEGNIQIEKIEDGNEQEELPPAPSREKWGSRISYILTLVGYAVGFGNIWRFPYQMRENGGFAFLIPYSIMLVVVGIPMFFLELAVGQRRRKGVVYSWAEVSPGLGGIGIACGWLCFIVGLYYNTLIAYCISYFVDSFVDPLPWTNCATAATVAGKVNKAFLSECREDLHGRSTKYYWFRRTLDISTGYDDIGHYNWYLFLYHIVMWGTIFGILVKGTKSVGAVVYVTAVLPYLVLFIFFVANLFIEPSKAWLGAYRLLKPNWSVLSSPITWLKAGTQIFFSLGVAYGCLVVFASYSPARNNCYSDAITISLINCGTSMFAALVVFPMVGLLGHYKYDECVTKWLNVIDSSWLKGSKSTDKHDIYFFTNAKTWEDVDNGANNITIRYGYGELTAQEKLGYTSAKYPNNVWEVIGPEKLINETYMKLHPLHEFSDCSIGQEATKSGGGTGFVFIGFTEAVKRMPGSNFWSTLFFVMLMTLGIDSGFGTIEGSIAALQDLTHMKRFMATSIMCGVLTIISLLVFPFGWGIYVLDLLDQWSANWTFLVIALLECFAVAWNYGLAKISYDIRLMTGSKPSLYILVCWKYLSPITIILLLVGSVTQFTYDSIKSQGIKYTAFNPKNMASVDGDVTKPLPVYSLVMGFVLLIFCIIWVPIHFFMRNTKWSLLKAQAPAEFPEEELREERHIDVEREEDQFTNTEKAIMGKRSLVNLQEERNKSKTDVIGGGRKKKSASSATSLKSM